jgi:ribosomal-protein-alanine N-acetyltransferase
MYPDGCYRDNLVEADVSKVSELQQQVMPNFWSAAAFNSSLKVGHGCYTLKNDCQIIAVAVTSQILDQAELLTIAVAKKEQGQGLATLFLRDLMYLLQVQMASQCMLEVMVGNDAAITVYERAGFKHVAKRKAYYHTQQGIFDALVMRIDY